MDTAKPPRPLVFPADAIQASQTVAAIAAVGVTVVCGFPAAGKTTVTRFLSELIDSVVLDKDTFAPQLEEAVMSELTGDPHDRDSDCYRRVVSPTCTPLWSAKR
ncbi:AAA family ATPase [Nocardia sp. NPDC049190]|uniref:AAA family ATPase n=1 Tax=Nocardia sp. NPDC049190 TaxID=3155650 RepID=UPI0033D8C3F8